MADPTGSERVYNREKQSVMLWILTGLLSLVSIVGGWLWVRAVDTIDDIGVRVRTIELWRGAKDEADAHRDDKLREIRDDVKELLRRSRP